MANPFVLQNINQALGTFARGYQGRQDFQAAQGEEKRRYETEQEWERVKERARRGDQMAQNAWRFYLTAMETYDPDTYGRIRTAYESQRSQAGEYGSVLPELPEQVTQRPPPTRAEELGFLGDIGGMVEKGTMPLGTANILGRETAPGLAGGLGTMPPSVSMGGQGGQPLAPPVASGMLAALGGIPGGAALAAPAARTILGQSEAGPQIMPGKPREFFQEPPAAAGMTENQKVLAIDRLTRRIASARTSNASRPIIASLVTELNKYLDQDISTDEIMKMPATTVYQTLSLELRRRGIVVSERQLGLEGRRVDLATRRQEFDEAAYAYQAARDVYSANMGNRDFQFRVEQEARNVIFSGSSLLGDIFKSEMPEEDRTLIQSIVEDAQSTLGGAGGATPKPKRAGRTTTGMPKGKKTGMPGGGDIPVLPGMPGMPEPGFSFQPSDEPIPKWGQYAPSGAPTGPPPPKPKPPRLVAGGAKEKRVRSYVDAHRDLPYNQLLAGVLSQPWAQGLNREAVGVAIKRRTAQQPTKRATGRRVTFKNPTRYAGPVKDIVDALRDGVPEADIIRLGAKYNPDAIRDVIRRYKRGEIKVR